MPPGTWTLRNLGHRELGPRRIVTVPCVYLCPQCTNRCPRAWIHLKKKPAPGDDEPLSYSNCNHSRYQSINEGKVNLILWGNCSLPAWSRVVGVQWPSTPRPPPGRLRAHVFKLHSIDTIRFLKDMHLFLKTLSFTQSISFRWTLWPSLWR